MADEVYESVAELLVQDHGLRRDRLRSTARLLQDLGVDGDDAAEFFQQVQQRFGTDFSGLYED